jgi:hypothetical protein
MPVERPRATLRTSGTPEPDIPDNLRELFDRVTKEPVSFFCQGSDAEGNGYKGDCDHQPDMYDN